MQRTIQLNLVVFAVLLSSVVCNGEESASTRTQAKQVNKPAVHFHVFKGVCSRSMRFLKSVKTLDEAIELCSKLDLFRTEILSSNLPTYDRDQWRSMKPVSSVRLYRIYNDKWKDVGEVHGRLINEGDLNLERARLIKHSEFKALPVVGVSSKASWQR